MFPEGTSPADVAAAVDALPADVVDGLRSVFADLKEFEAADPEALADPGAVSRRYLELCERMEELSARVDAAEAEARAEAEAAAAAAAVEAERRRRERERAEQRPWGSWAEEAGGGVGISGSSGNVGSSVRVGGTRGFIGPLPPRTPSAAVVDEPSLKKQRGQQLRSSRPVATR